MDSHSPLVTVGLPVFNGARYVGEAIESVLGQTLRDLELVICDNASTDETEAICQGFAARDPRVKYHRQPENVGAAANFNLAFDLSASPYFKWIAADDWLEPQFLERCVDLLEREPGLIGAGSRYVIVDEIAGTVTRTDYDHDLGDSNPSRRLRKLFGRGCGQEHVVWVVARSDALRGTHLFEPMVGGDFHMVVDLVLRGPVAQSSDYLNCLRVHEHAYSSKLRHENLGRDGMQGEAEAHWWGEGNLRGAALPHWRLLVSYARLIFETRESPARKISLFACLVHPIAARWRVILLKELVFAAGLGPVWVALRREYRRLHPNVPAPPAPQGDRP